MKKTVSLLLCFVLLMGMCLLTSCETPSERKARKAREELERNADKYTVELRVNLENGYDWERITSGSGRVKISDRFSSSDDTKLTGKRIFTVTARKAGTAKVVFTRRIDELTVPDEYAEYTFKINDQLKFTEIKSGGNYFERIQNEQLTEAQMS